jgi:polyketide synthase 12
VAACDVTVPDALANLVAWAGPLAGVVHLAGAAGAWQLHELTARMDLAAFVMFSSLAEKLGTAGQGGGAVLDRLAAFRREQGLPGLSLAWGPFDDLAEPDLARMRAAGFVPLSRTWVMDLFDAALAADRPVVVAARIESGALAARARSGRLPALLRDLVREPVRGAAAPQPSELSARLAGLGAAQRYELILQLVRGQAAAVLGHRATGAVAPDAAFQDLGLDSSTAVELRNRLTAATGLRLPATMAFDYPSPAALGRYLLGRVVPTDASAPVTATVPVTRRGADGDPVAVVGIGCRFPGGAASAEELWELVAAGRDALGEYPADRGWDTEGLFDSVSGKSYAQRGGFVYDAAEFDAGFFGISPREALAMDPQQRLLLECSWEALEDAGIDPASLRGTQTGVFTGYQAQEYGRVGDHNGVDCHLLTGTIASMGSGRVAYVLGLEGPALSVDTACSSALVALHLAVQSLRRGECSLALAGAATVMSTPRVFTEFARQGGLAADGRCKPYSSAADGTGFSEGTGVLVLERLPDAVRNGHRVLGVVAASAVNQDGASNGLTAPNGPSQERVIRAALADAALATSDVDVVEGHGTGTVLGDPIEAGALLATYGQGRAEGSPVWLGSVKSNIGHSQTSAGMAGVIKVLMALRHEQMPATLHADEPSPHVDWDSGGQVALLTVARPWPHLPGRVRRAGVSSFGMSGTNAHVIIAEPPVILAGAAVPAVPAGDAGAGGVLAWVVSGKTAAGLAGQAARIGGFMAARPGLEPGAVAAGLAVRSSFPYRAVVTGAGRDELLAGLAAVAAGVPAPGVVTGTAGLGLGKAVFVFPGQGGQWTGMGADLLESCPVFAGEVAACDRVLEPLLGWRPSDVLSGAAGAPALERPDVVQPALFTMMAGLARVWWWLGVEPAAVAGHSQGEIAAAYMAGVLSLEDAARVVAARGKALAALAGTGAMATVGVSEQEAAALSARWPGLAVAAVNGPSSVVISGPPGPVGELVEACTADGVRARLLAVDYASHSAQVGPVRQELAEALAGISPRPGTVPFWSGLTGQVMDGTTLDAAYWYDSLRGQVRFEEVVRGLAGAGYGAFIETSPHPVLTVPVQEVLDDAGSAAVVTGTLRRDSGTPRQLLTAAAEVHVRGVPVDWPVLWPGIARAELPGYAFQRDRYWLTSTGSGDAAGAGLEDAGGHPLLGAAVELADGQGVVLTGRISVAAQPWLADHMVHGMAVLPGAALAELAWHAGTLQGCAALEELTILAPLVLPGTGRVQIQVMAGPPDEEGRRPVTVSARPAGGGQDWTRHAEGTAGPGPAAAGAAAWAGTWPPQGAAKAEAAELYERLARAGYEYGPAFRAVTSAWRCGDELFAEITLPDGVSGAGFGLHPVLLDASMHAAGLADLADLGEPGLDRDVLVPFAWSGLALMPAMAAGTLRVRLTSAGPDGMSVTITDQAGQMAGRIGSVRSRPVSAAQLAASGSSGLLSVDWVPVQVRVPGEASAEWVVAGPDLVGLAGLLGARCAGVYPGLADLAAAVDGGAPVPPVVAVIAVSGTGAMPGAVGDACTGVLEILRWWLGWEPAAGSVLVVVTCGAVTVGGGDPVRDLSGAAVGGLIRSAQAEEPGRFALADIDIQPASAEALAEALAAVPGCGEPQVAVRAGQLLAPRLARPIHGLTVPAGPWRLAVGRPGTLDGLVLAVNPDAAGPLGPGQVRVAIRAGGVNFRDVLITLGMYPGGDLLIGNEAAGIVTEAGPGVTGLAPGDAVTGLLPGGIGPVAVTDQRLLARVPPGWSFAQAAAVPVAFLTAWYGLVDLGGLAAGQTVLIHSGAGGVGMAAVQLARHLGARVLATASPGKHHVLAGLGLDPECIASSRTTAFEQQFAEVTGGRGADVVLNCLAGEFTDASLRLLAPGGRFIEMGKADIRDPATLQVPGARYRAFDLMEAGHDRIAQILAALGDLFRAGTLKPLPVTAWDVREAPAAFRHMSQARHTGKLVLTIPYPQAALGAGPVLVTGGTGTLGALVTRHLAATRQPRHLILTSRRGPAAPGAGPLAAGLAGHGASVQVIACDTADRPAVAGLLASTGPLTGVIHLAGLLDDGPIGSLTAQRFQTVLRAKADAAWHLHELTAGMDLAMFVMFSSASGTLGSPGQGNYAAANAYLDALAQWRRQQGLPGLSMAWGLWAEASGMTGHLGQADLARMRRGGVVPMSSDQGLELFDAGLSAVRAAVVTALIDVRALSAVPPMLRGLVRRPAARTAAAAATAGPGGLAERLTGLDEAGRQETVLQVVRAQASAVLGHDGPDAVEPGAAFRDLGFDSLTAVELRNRLAAASGLRLPATVIFDYPSPAALATHLCALLLPSQPPQAVALTDVFADIARWNAVLPQIRENNNSRTKLTELLREFLEKVETCDVVPAEALDGSATVDEVYEYIETQLGIPYPG